MAERFGSEGFAVALIARNEERLAAGVSALAARGIKAAGFTGDAGDPDSIRTTLDRVRSQMAPIDVLHWNAYGGLDAGDLLTAGEATQHVFDVAIYGLLAATDAVLTDLKGNAGAILVSNGAFGDATATMDAAAADAKVMGLALASAAKNKLVGMLAQRLKSEGIYVGEVIVHATIKGTPSGQGDSVDPAVIAGEYWKLYTLRNQTRANLYPPRTDSKFNPEAFVREAYAIAERKDFEGWKALFADDGLFIDESVKATYSSGDDWDYPVRNYGAAFADMHRELYNFWTVGNTVFVRLALQGTHTGPLQTPFGTIPATGKKMDAPCVDVWELENGKIKKFDCYPSGSVILTQLGVIENLEAAVSHE
jgi:NAD(P)-dependent dehydrogenase (short-subunit alcohol dehydrogenase family)